MRIAIVGNLCNIGFITLEALNKQGFEAVLFISEHELQTMSDPREEEEGCFSEKKIFFWELCKNRKDVKLVKENMLYDIPPDNKFAIICLSFYLRRNFDFVIGVALGSIMAFFSGKPYLWIATGSDLREWIFKFKLSSIALRLVAAFSKAVLAGKDKPTLIAAKRAGIGSKIREMPFFPVNIDKIRSYCNFLGLKKSKVLTIFNPSNQLWALKGNDKLIKAISEVIKEGYELSLVLLKRGEDYIKSKMLVEELGISQNVQWKAAMTKKELIVMMSISDVIADQFVLGDIGGISREAICIGKPVLAYLEDETDIRPVLNCFTIDEIKEQIKRCFDEEFRVSVEKKAYCFANEYYSFEHYGSLLGAIITQYVEKE